MNIFPTLPGLDIAIKRSVITSTMVQPASSGKEQRGTFWSTPRYSFDLTLNFARQAGFSAQTAFDEAQTLISFFAGQGGQGGKLIPFWLTDPFNATAVTVACGTGTGAAGQTTQLIDLLGVAVAPNGAPSLYVAGVLQTVTTNYTVSSTGLVTWVTQPGSGAAITWSGAFYYTVRFDQDALDMERIVNLAWKGGSLKLISVK